MQKTSMLLFFPALAILAIILPVRAQSSSELEKNKNVVRSFIEVLDQGKLEKYSESHAADFVAHGSTHDATLEEDMAAARDERQAMPDMRATVNQMVAEGDLVAVHWTVAGTNTQPGMGFPATGKKIKISGMTLFRFKGGKISEEWSFWNMLSVLKQAGLYPAQP